MFLISGGSGLSALAVSYLTAWRLTEERQRLRLDRLEEQMLITARSHSANERYKLAY